jgi:hypothetical protein
MSHTILGPSTSLDFEYEVARNQHGWELLAKFAQTSPFCDAGVTRFRCEESSRSIEETEHRFDVRVGHHQSAYFKSRRVASRVQLTIYHNIKSTFESNPVILLSSSTNHTVCIPPSPGSLVCMIALG